MELQAVEGIDLSNRFQQAVAEDQKWLEQIFMPGTDGSLVNIVPLSPCYLKVRGPICFFVLFFFVPFNFLKYSSHVC